MPGSPQSGCLDLSFRSQLDLPKPRFHLGLGIKEKAEFFQIGDARPLLPLPIENSCRACPGNRLRLTGQGKSPCGMRFPGVNNHLGLPKHVIGGGGTEGTHDRNKPNPQLLKIAWRMTPGVHSPVTRHTATDGRTGGNAPRPPPWYPQGACHGAW